MRLWIDLWEWFFPRDCLLCGRTLLREEEGLCLGCLARLPRTGLHRQRENRVERNFWGKFPVERATSFLHYAKEGLTRQLVFELKYRGCKEVGEVMGRVAAAEIRPSSFFEGIDQIIPVPLHPRKERQRGYNQSEWIAKGLSAVTGIPVQARAIVRDRYTETQTRKGQYERWENVHGLFSCPSPASLRGQHVLLVDDVLTTGATLAACAKALGSVPGIKISVFTLAWAGEV